MPDGLPRDHKKVGLAPEAVNVMQPGEKTGLGMMALMGLCCGGLPALAVAGPAIAGALSGAWPLVIVPPALFLGLVAYRRHCRSCKAPVEAEGR